MNLIIEDSKKTTLLPAILKAALQLFVEKGIEVTTTKDIAKRARVSEGALYRHFKSKEQLAWHLFSIHLDRFSRQVQEKVDAAKDAQAKIFAVVSACFEAFETERDLFSYLILSEHREFRKYPAARNHVGLVILGVIEAGQKKRAIRREDPNLLTALVLGTVIRTCLFKIYGRIKADLRRLDANVADASWRALKL